MTKTSDRNRTIMSAIAIVIGLLMVSVVPFLTQTALDRVLTNLMEHSKSHPEFASGLNLFDLFYPIWRAVIFVAGTALILTSQEIRKGERWAYSLAMLLFAMPAIGGMFMFLPYVSWVDGFPLPMIISLIGLAGFWSFIWLREGTRAQRFAQFGALTFIGMMATHAFTVGIGAQRTMMTRPGHPLYPGFEWWLFNWIGEVNWVAVALLIPAIPLLALNKKLGWWLALVGAVSILLIDAPSQFIRTKTLDYLYGSLLAAGVLVFLLTPYFRRQLLREEEPAKEEALHTESGPGKAAMAQADRS